MMQTLKRLEDFGASPSSPDNSEAFAKAISFFQEQGGGTLRIGSGVWATGPIRLCSSLTLELEEDSVISFIPEAERYRPVKTRWEGVVCYAMQPCIFADGSKDVSIRGKGIIDGNGASWWEQVRQKRGQKGPLLPIERELAALNPGYESQPGGGGGRASQFLRPALLQFHECSGVKVEGIRLQNSPFWTLHPLFCSDVLLKDLDICNPPDAPNTDGMDIDSCDGVQIESC
ncbi:MAG: glycoside hydrolase family 28 protein, partial [Treponema sp.]|nr:glycoside hydrolase family 28 protein [Treponema sp.]